MSRKRPVNQFLWGLSSVFAFPGALSTWRYSFDEAIVWCVRFVSYRPPSSPAGNNNHSSSKIKLPTSSKNNVTIKKQTKKKRAFKVQRKTFCGIIFAVQGPVEFLRSYSSYTQSDSGVQLDSTLLAS